MNNFSSCANLSKVNHLENAILNLVDVSIINEYVLDIRFKNEKDSLVEGY